MLLAPLWRHSDRLQDVIWSPANLDLIEKTQEHNLAYPGARVEVVDDGSQLKVIIILGDSTQSKELGAAREVAQDWQQRLRTLQPSSVPLDEFLEGVARRKAAGQTYRAIADSLNSELTELVFRWLESWYKAAQLELEEGRSVPDPFVTGKFDGADSRLLMHVRTILDWLQPDPELADEALRCAVHQALGRLRGHLKDRDESVLFFNRDIIIDRLKAWRKRNRARSPRPLAYY